MSASPFTPKPWFARPFSAVRFWLAGPRTAMDGLRPSRVFDRFVAARLNEGPAPIVPPSSLAGRALTVVIAIMTFLACLTAGGVYMVNRSASAWFSDVTSEVTVQVMPAPAAEIEKKVTLVALFLSKQNGIARVKPMTAAQSAELVEPWLGKTEALSALPIPRLIAVEIDHANPPDFAAISQALASSFEGVTLDDHGRWQAQIRGLTRSLALGGLTVLALVALATVAVIVSATRSAMASNREIVEVLHLVGANDRFIAREFERHFRSLSVRAGLVGAIAAAIVFLLMPFLTSMLSGNVVTSAEIRRLVGNAVLDATGYLLFVLVVVVVALLAMATTRYGVYRVLKAQR